jgi:23S rRNA (pseudouridine1915-N3)-methyltransferase
MKISLIAVGTKMPAWVNDGVAEYSKRLPSSFNLTVQEVPLAKRGKSYNVEQCVNKEANLILERVPKNDHLVAMEVTGKVFDTPALAKRIDKLRDDGRNLSLLVGGPDGLADQCLSRADEHWSLSALTLPHALVRVMLAEQLYRVWSVLNGHPYHRD